MKGLILSAGVCNLYYGTSPEAEACTISHDIRLGGLAPNTGWDGGNSHALIFQAGERYLSMTAEDPESLLARETIMVILCQRPLAHRLWPYLTLHLAAERPFAEIDEYF